MASVKIKRFGNPDFLRQIHAENLRALLLRFADFFERIQFAIPEGDFCPEDLEKLSAHLVSPPSHTPGPLLDAIEMLEMLTSGNGWTELQMIAPDLVRALTKSNDSPADVAVKVWILDPGAIERIYTKFSIDSGRSMVCYRAPAETPITRPTKAICKSIAESLSLHFATLFSTPASQVMSFDEDSGQAFLIRHGDMVKRLGVINDDGEPDTKALRPLKHDVAFLIPDSWELQVSGRSESIRELYRSVFSRHIFGDSKALKPAKRFTLEPLRTGRNCLEVADIASIEGVALRELHLRRRRSSSQTIHRADDVFTEIEAHGHGYLNDYELTRARFSIRVRGRRKSLSLCIAPDEDTLRGDVHDPLATQWLEACRFTNHHASENVLANA
jgi:hypothetical protein